MLSNSFWLLWHGVFPITGLRKCWNIWLIVTHAGSHPLVTWGWTHQWGAWQWVSTPHHLSVYGTSLNVAYMPSRMWLTLLYCTCQYAIYAMFTNCCVLFTGYAWSHVVCHAGAISALLLPLVCALCFCACVCVWFSWVFEGQHSKLPLRAIKATSTCHSYSKLQNSFT